MITSNKPKLGEIYVISCRIAMWSNEKTTDVDRIANILSGDVVVVLQHFPPAHQTSIYDQVRVLSRHGVGVVYFDERFSLVA